MSRRDRKGRSATRAPAGKSGRVIASPPSAAGRALTLRLACAGLILLLVTLVIYPPAWHGGLLWDDDGHLTRPELRSLHGLWRIWFDVGGTQQYYPAAHSAFW